MFGARALRDAHMVTFFFADFVTCANFSNLSGKFPKPRTDTDTMFSLKVAQDPRLHFRRQKIEENLASWVFFRRIFEKTLFLAVFFCLIPYFSEPRPDTEFMVSILYKRFICCYTFAKKWRQKFFWDLVFWEKKGWKKCRFFFSFVAHISQYWRKIQKPFSLKTNSKDVS